MSLQMGISTRAIISYENSKQGESGSGPCDALELIRKWDTDGIAEGWNCKQESDGELGTHKFHDKESCGCEEH